jgi:transcription elongation factor Elf1
LIYHLGECPVCAGSGILICLVSHASGEVVLFCPLCETAWRRLPEPRQVDEINSLSDLAPRGVRLATAEEVVRAGLGRPRTDEAEEWFHFLEEHLS